MELLFLVIPMDRQNLQFLEKNQRLFFQSRLSPFERMNRIHYGIFLKKKNHADPKNRNPEENRKVFYTSPILFIAC